MGRTERGEGLVYGLMEGDPCFAGQRGPLFISDLCPVIKEDKVIIVKPEPVRIYSNDIFAAEIIEFGSLNAYLIIYEPGILARNITDAPFEKLVQEDPIFFREVRNNGSLTSILVKIQEQVVFVILKRGPVLRRKRREEDLITADVSIPNSFGFRILLVELRAAAQTKGGDHKECKKLFHIA